ncbi:hypothetical protein BRC64_08965 [Halobacteriales archaeon QH_10_67_22]|nr:MAG: hypothetical protein BRC64_08965 [Halobacteriales archaeon QH_10_67_22]
MRAVTKPLDEQARSIFDELGYDVRTRGTELLAERKWRVVHVTTIGDDDETPKSGDYRCFVAWNEDVDAVERQLRREDPDYEWAVLGVDEGGDYEVTRAPEAA